jgi:hypothetical protein
MLTALLATLLLSAPPAEPMYPSYNVCIDECTKAQTECECVCDVDACENSKLMCVAKCDRLLIEGKFCLPKCEAQWKRCMNAPFSTPAGCDRQYATCEATCVDEAFR